MMTQGTFIRALGARAPVEHSWKTAPAPGSPPPDARATLVLALLLTLTLVGFFLLLPAPAPRDLGVPHMPAVTVLSAVPCPVPAPDSAAGYERAFDSLSGGWAGGDQTSSTLLPDGRVLWLFGDTLQGTWTPEGALIGGRMVHNSFVIQDAGCFTPMTGPGGAEVIPNEPDGQWYWPQHALADGSRLWVTAMRVAGIAPNSLSFSIRGMVLAEFTLRPSGLPRFVGLHRSPASEAGDFGVLWGTGLAREGALVYVYGTRRSLQSVLGRDLLLASAPLARLTEPSAWRYRTASGWSPDPTRAAILVPADGGVSTALSAHRSDAGWVLITKRDEFLGTDVVALEGDDPWGPFTIHTLFAAPSEGNEMAYQPLAHPELALRDGSLLVTVNHNNTSLAVVLRDHEAFRPTFTAVDHLN